MTEHNDCQKRGLVRNEEETLLKTPFGPLSFYLSFSLRQCQCQCASHDRPINNHEEQISELQRGMGGWSSGELEREWAGSMRGVRRTNLERRGMFPCHFCAPFLLRDSRACLRGRLEHTASKCSKKYVHLALTFFLGVTGFEGIRDIFLRLRPKLSGQIANLKFKHEIRGRNFPQLNPVLLPSISSICSTLIYSQSVSALMSPRSIVSPAAKTFPDQSG